MSKKKICVIIGSSMNLHGLYRDQFKFLRENGYEVTGLAPAGEEHEWLRKQGFKTKVIHLKRPPSVFHDIFSLCQLTLFLALNRFDIINVSTPKASLIGSLAAYISFHKNIVYNLRGRAYEMATGNTRRFYETVEKVVCKISKKVLCDSKEIRDDVIKSGLCSEEKIIVFGSGSSNGVDLKKFTKNSEIIEEGQKIRTKLGLEENDILILNSGRIRKDKGINELVRAFHSLIQDHCNLHLLIQGKYDDFDPLDESVMDLIEKHPKIHQAEWARNVEYFFSAANIFAFPTHREGFGNVAIEASAMELPVVAFNVIGCRESVRNEISGILCGEVSAKNLERGLERLIIDKEYRVGLGLLGRKRVEKEFDSLQIWWKLLEVYNILLNISCTKSYEAKIIEGMKDSSRVLEESFSTK